MSYHSVRLVLKQHSQKTRPLLLYIIRRYLHRILLDFIHRCLAGVDLPVTYVDLLVAGVDLPVTNVDLIDITDSVQDENKACKCI
jgi:hypothetical protein